jgi:hypothetical protein
MKVLLYCIISIISISVVVAYKDMKDDNFYQMRTEPYPVYSIALSNKTYYIIERDMEEDDGTVVHLVDRKTWMRSRVVILTLWSNDYISKSESRNGRELKLYAKGNGNDFVMESWNWYGGENEKYSDNSSSVIEHEIPKKNTSTDLEWMQFFGFHNSKDQRSQMSN